MLYKVGVRVWEVMSVKKRECTSVWREKVYTCMYAHVSTINEPHLPE